VQRLERAIAEYEAQHAEETEAEGSSD
jgi:hypothetical protein